jgi:hypothetical protein
VPALKGKKTVRKYTPENAGSLKGLPGGALDPFLGRFRNSDSQITTVQIRDDCPDIAHIGFLPY